MINRKELEEREKYLLKPYACFSNNYERLLSSNVILTPHPLRTEFQRDRDRILHSKSFRRLEYKTQVYLTENGDHLRTRLTHSLEVSQIARTIALQLGLNTDLIEAISLGHDVGHTPFGHCAERSLNKLLQADGYSGFKHNVQSVIIFYNLEKKYEYNGLGLTIAVLEGILKHTKFNITLPSFFDRLYIDKEYSITLEGQVVAIADEIALITHDLDDYLRYNIIPLEEFLNHEIFEKISQFTETVYNREFKNLINLDIDREKEVIIRCLLDYLITTIIKESTEVLSDNLIAYELDKTYIDYTYSKEIVESFQKHIEHKCISEYRVQQMDKRGVEVVNTLYEYYKTFPNKLPPNTYEKYIVDGIPTIANYISGMTDRYAKQEYSNIIRL